MAEIVQHDGLWWPTSDVWARKVIPGEVGPAISWLKAHNRRWETCIQAGGNVGVYPAALEPLFDMTWTFEPDAVNRECMLRNLRSARQVLIYTGALGETNSHCQMLEHDANNCGAYRIDETDEGIPVYRIDDCWGRRPNHVSLIWLDVEGYELQALKGAINVLAKSKPTVIVELKGLGKSYGYDDDAVRSFLTDHGYAFRSRHENDEMWEAR